MRPSMSLLSPCSTILMLVNRSTTLPRRRLSSSWRAKFLGRMSLRRLFSRSMARMASSMTVPISGVCAAAAITPHRALSGTKKMFSAVYSSLSSSKPSPSATSSLYFVSKRSDMYFKKIRPSTTDLYSDASMFPRSTQAASQICFSKPILLVFVSGIFLSSKRQLIIHAHVFCIMSNYSK